MEGNKTTFILSDKRWFPAQRVFLIFGLLLAITFLLVVLAIITIFPDAPWEQLPAKLTERIGTVDWWHAFFRHLDAVAILGIVLGQILYQIRAKKLERLTLSPDGIRYTSPLPHVLKRFKPDWLLQWGQVKKAELGTLNGRLIQPGLVLLTFTSESGKRKIYPTHWVDPENFSPPVSRFKLTLTPIAQPHDKILESVLASDVMRFISKNVPNINIDSTFNKAEVFTSLEKNPHGRIAIVIIFLLMAYTFLDFIGGPESYIDDPSSLLHIYISAGIIGAILSGAWLYKSTLVFAEKIGLAMLIGGLVAVAMLPGALRINSFTDSNSANTYDYFVTQSTDGVVLRPVVDGMPNIDYFAKNKFWGRFEKDDTYPVLIHKGSLGFYQFNSSAIADDIHNREKN